MDQNWLDQTPGLVTETSMPVYLFYFHGKDVRKIGSYEISMQTVTLKHQIMST